MKKIQNLTKEEIKSHVEMYCTTVINRNVDDDREKKSVSLVRLGDISDSQERASVQSVDVTVKEYRYGKKKFPMYPEVKTYELLWNSDAQCFFECNRK